MPSPKDDQGSSVSLLLEQTEGLIARRERELAREEMGLGKERNRVLERTKVQDLQSSLRDATVRRVFHRIFELAGILRPYGDPNPIVMAHQAGRASMALELYEACETAQPGVYLQMCREAKSNEKSLEENNAS